MAEVARYIRHHLAETNYSKKAAPEKMVLVQSLWETSYLLVREVSGARRLTVALSAWMLWARGKPIEVRMAMLSSGGELSSGAAPIGVSLVEGPGSIMEGRVSGSAKSEKREGECFRMRCSALFLKPVRKDVCLGGRPEPKHLFAVLLLWNTPTRIEIY